MPKRITIRLDKNGEENLSFLYKHYKIPNESEAKRLTELLIRCGEGILHGSQDEKHLGHEEEVRLLEGWDCPCRFPVWRYHKPTKEFYRKVLCSNPNTQEILRTNELDAEVCKRCYDTGGSVNFPALPEPKKQVSKPTPKPKPTVTKQECIDCGTPIPINPNKPRCYKCWYGSIKGAKAQGEYDKNPPASSPAGIRKREADRLRKLDERMKQPKEE